MLEFPDIFIVHSKREGTIFGFFDMLVQVLSKIVNKNEVSKM